MFRSSYPSTPKQASPAQQNSQPIYIVVFGYPPDKYSITVEYFRSLGETTDAEQSSELLNCFRIGYLRPGEAFRAVRKNGEILNGAWMVGAKWAVCSIPISSTHQRHIDYQFCRILLRRKRSSDLPLFEAQLNRQSSWPLALTQ